MFGKDFMGRWMLSFPCRMVTVGIHRDWGRGRDRPEVELGIIYLEATREAEFIYGYWVIRCWDHAVEGFELLPKEFGLEPLGNKAFLLLYT